MDDLEVGSYTIRAHELEEDFQTAGGPGGQHANRNATAVRLRFRVRSSSLPAEAKRRIIETIGDPVDVVASDSRSQFRNRAIARERLRDRIERSLESAPDRRTTQPTRSSKERRLAAKRARGETKRLRQTPPPDQ